MTQFIAKGFRKRDMRDYPIPEEGADAPAGAVDYLVGNQEGSGLNFLLEAAAGADSDNMLNADRFEGVDIGPGRDFTGENAVSAAMAGQEGNADAIEFSDG